MGRGTISPDLEGQIDKAFDNVLKAHKAVDESLSLDNAHISGSYHLGMDASFDVMESMFKKMVPNHRPIWTVRWESLVLRGCKWRLKLRRRLLEDGC